MNIKYQFACFSLVSNLYALPFGVIKHFSSLSGKSIAIIGGGYSGIGCAYQLRHSGAKISLYDPSPIGFGGASAVSAGMMHPLGVSGNMLHRGVEAYFEAMSVISFASEHGFQYRKDGIIRYFDKPRDCEKFRRNSAGSPEVGNLLQHDFCAMFKNFISQWAKDLSQHEWPSVLPSNAIFAIRLTNSIVINSCDFIRIFWGAIKKYISLRHFNYRVSKVTDIAKINDIVLCCAGSSIGSIWDAPLPPLHFIKGQNIAYDFNSELADANYDAIICGKYLIIDRVARRLLFGATYEYMDSSSSISEQRKSD